MRLAILCGLIDTFSEPAINFVSDYLEAQYQDLPAVADQAQLDVEFLHKFQLDCQDVAQGPGSSGQPGDFDILNNGDPVPQPKSPARITALPSSPSTSSMSSTAGFTAASSPFAGLASSQVGNAAQAAAQAALQGNNPLDADEDGASLGSDVMAGGNVDWDEEPRLDVKASVMSGGGTPMLVAPLSPVSGAVGLSTLAYQHHKALCGRLNQPNDPIRRLADQGGRLVAGQAEGTRILGGMHRGQEEWTRRSITRIDNALVGNRHIIG